MKNKFLVLALLASSTMAMAVEGQIRFGYDFLRTVNKTAKPTTAVGKYVNGLNLAVEVIPVNVLNNRLELGLGAEYSGGLFSLTSNAVKSAPVAVAVPNAEAAAASSAPAAAKTEELKNNMFSIPVYGLIKGNFVNLKSNDTLLYGVLKAGYAFGNTAVKGPYIGLGVGTEYKTFVFELDYSATISANNDFPNTYHRFGIQIGGLINPPKMEEPKVEKPMMEKPMMEKPMMEKPMMEKPMMEKPKMEEPAPVQKKEHGYLVYNVTNQQDTGLTLEGYNIDNSIPDTVYISNNTGQLLQEESGVLAGSKGTTDAKVVYIIQPNDTPIIYDGKVVESFVPIKTADLEKEGYKLARQKNGLVGLVPIVKEVPKPVEKPKPVVVLPSNCDGDQCVIHGYKVNYRLPNAEELQQIKILVNKINDYAKSADITVIGYTDSTGTVKYNEKLGLFRAQDVAKLLVENGLKKEIVIKVVKSGGEFNPMATNKTKDGRFLNRRVVIKFENLVK